MDKLKIPINHEVLSKIFTYAYYAKAHLGTEIAGWAHYTPKKGIYKLAPLTKQEVSGAEVDNFPNEILNDINYDIRDMIVQWHSHVDMNVFASPTDLSNIKETLKLMPAVISIIVNCKNQYYARLDTVMAGGALGVNLDTSLIFDVDLVPFYSDTEVSREVKSKLSLPKPRIITLPSRPIEISGKTGSESGSVYFEGRYCYPGKDGKWGYWDITEKRFISIEEAKKKRAEKEEKERAEREPKIMDYIDWGIEQVNQAIAAFVEIATTMPDEFMYNPADSDSLEHIPTGEKISITDWGIQYGKEIGGKELIQKFLETISYDDKKAAT